MIFLDTNVFIAASIAGHSHHEACRLRVSQSLRSEGACAAAHSMAECYSALTRTGKGYGLPPLSALQIVEDLSRKLTLVSLTPNETLQAIQDAAEHGISGPLLSDALLLACARKMKARTIYTNDVYDFRRIAPDLASRIREP